MAASFLARFLAVVSMPPDVAPEIIAVYQYTYPAELARNPSISGMDRRALSGLSGEDLAEAIEFHNRDALEMVLAGRESRNCVIQSVLDNWDLSAKDQLRLANRNLPKKSAEAILKGNFTKRLQRAAFAKVTPAVRLAWLAANEPSDSTFTRKMLKLAPEVTSMPALVSALLIRRSLRPVALRSSQRNLKLAACWTELEESDQGYATEFALGAKAYGSTFDPVVGLLNQPGLATEYRLQLEHYMDEKLRVVKSEGISSVHTLGLGWRKQFEPAPVASTRSRSRIQDLMKAARRSTRGNIVSRERAVTVPLLYELSLNEHLNRRDSMLLAETLSHHVDLCRTMKNPALGTAYFRVLHRVEGEAVMALEVKNSGMYPPEVRALHPFARTTPPKISEPIPMGDLIWKGWRNVNVEYLLNSTVREMAYFNAISDCDLERFGPEFIKRLGDGSDETSKRNWLNFLGLCESGPAIAVKTVIDTATRLVAAEK